MAIRYGLLVIRFLMFFLLKFVMYPVEQVIACILLEIYVMIRLRWSRIMPALGLRKVAFSGVLFYLLSNVPKWIAFPRFGFPSCG